MINFVISFSIRDHFYDQNSILKQYMFSFDRNDPLVTNDNMLQVNGQYKPFNI